MGLNATYGLLAFGRGLGFWGRLGSLETQTVNGQRR